MSVQAAYNNWSATYDADENLTRDLDQVVTRETLTVLRCKSVVEIGCGTGKNTLLLSQIAEKVYAIDFSAYMIEKAKEKVRRSNVIFLTADITKQWACSNGSADLITCNLVLEHIEDFSFIFSEAFRVLYHVRINSYDIQPSPPSPLPSMGEGSERGRGEGSSSITSKNFWRIK